MLFNNSTMKSLSMEQCGLGEHEGQSLSKGLGNSPNLKYLNLANNNLKDEGVKEFKDPLCTDMIQLRHLNL